jgi:probable F420-dependent oxidoreductase
MSARPRAGLDLRGLGRVGAFVANLSRFTLGETRELAAVLENLGYRTLAFGESLGRESFAQAAILLASTSSLVVMTGIASIYSRDPWAMMNGARTLLEAYPGRFVLGIGVSHPKLVQRRGHVYEKPAPTMRSYVSAMNAAPWPTETPPNPRIVIAALRRAMLNVVRDCADGTEPYFSPVAHSELARRLLGEEAWLCPIQTFVSASNRSEARARQERHMRMFLGMPNYRDNLVALGYVPDDLDGAGSERLFDDLIAWGGATNLEERIRQHIGARADHVQIEVFADTYEELLDGYRVAASVVS